MSHAHIKRLNERIAEARRQGMTDQEVINVLADVAKSSPEGMRNLLAARDDAVRKNRTDLRAAIEQVLLNPTNTFAVPALDAAVEKALEPNKEGKDG